MKKYLALALIALGATALTGCLPPPHHHGDDGSYHHRDRDHDRPDVQHPDTRPDNRGGPDNHRGPGPR